MSAPIRCLQVFARPPVAGQVKTRLIPALGPTGATTVYRRLLGIALDAGVRAAAHRRELWLATTDDDPPPDLPAADRFTCFRQRGDDLGARMYNALADGLERADRVVLTGSDCPELDAAYIDAAFAALRDSDAVLGPTRDGGYVLIGLRRLHQDLFRDIAWSTSTVFDTTARRLDRLGWTWSGLATLRDIDEPADLEQFPWLVRA